MSTKSKYAGLPKLRAPFKKRWLAHLRSGDYRQVQGSLKEIMIISSGQPVVGHCCLGVACDIAEPDKWSSPVALNAGAMYRMGGANTFPPDFVHDSMFTQATIKKYGYNGIEDAICSLAEANDAGRSFKQIANIIERWM